MDLLSSHQFHWDKKYQPLPSQSERKSTAELILSCPNSPCCCDVLNTLACLVFRSGVASGLKLRQLKLVRDCSAVSLTKSLIFSSFHMMDRQDDRRLHMLDKPFTHCAFCRMIVKNIMIFSILYFGASTSSMKSLSQLLDAYISESFFHLLKTKNLNPQA